MLHKSGVPPQRLVSDPVDALRIELEVFADAIEGKAAFPIARSDMLGTVAAFEAVVKALETDDSVEVQPLPPLDQRNGKFIAGAPDSVQPA